MREPRLLRAARTPRRPRELADHACIAFTSVTPSDTWTFAAGPSGKASRHVTVHPSLTVNTAEAAIGSALDGRGVTCVLSYQVVSELEDGRLVRLLTTYEPAPVPVYLVHPAGSAAVARVRAFLDVAVPRLRARLRARLPQRTTLPPTRGSERKRRGHGRPAER